MQYPICRHIKTNGLQCQAPALNEAPYCYFHTRLHQRHRGFRYSEATRAYLIPGQHIELSPLPRTARLSVGHLRGRQRPRHRTA